MDKTTRPYVVVYKKDTYEIMFKGTRREVSDWLGLKNYSEIYRILYKGNYKDLEFDILEPLYELIDTVEEISLGTFTRDEILNQYSIDDTYFNKLVHGLHLLDRYIEVRRVQ